MIGPSPKNGVRRYASMVRNKLHNALKTTLKQLNRLSLKFHFSFNLILTQPYKVYNV